MTLDREPKQVSHTFMTTKTHNEPYLSHGHLRELTRRPCPAAVNILLFVRLAWQQGRTVRHRAIPWAAIYPPQNLGWDSTDELAAEGWWPLAS